MLVQSKLLELDTKGKLILEQEKVIDQCFVSLQNRTIMEYLIKWKNMPSKEATWEDEKFMKKHLQLQALTLNYSQGMELLILSIFMLFGVFGT